MNSDEIIRIIEACRKYGVKSILINGIKIEFAVDTTNTQLNLFNEEKTSLNSNEEKSEKKDESLEKKNLLLSEIPADEREELISDLLISDPATYERALIHGVIQGREVSI